MNKAIQLAKAAYDALLAERAALQAQLTQAEAALAPLAARLATIRKRRSRTTIISNTGGSIWFGTLADLRAQTYGAGVTGKPKAIADALASGGLKLGTGGYGGVSITLRGLAGRVRVPDKAHVAAHKKAVAARVRADQRAREAKAAEDAALKVCFETAVKVPADAIMPDLVAEIVADARLRAAPQPHELRHHVERFDSWEGAPLRVALDHLKFAKSGSAEPCPCAHCAADRQRAIKLRDLNARLDELPTILADCPIDGHGRHRLAAQSGLTRYLHDDARASWTAFATERNLTHVLAWLDSDASRVGQIEIPTGWCRKGKDEPRQMPLLTEFDRQLGRKARAKSGRVANEFVCPNPDCGERSPYLPEDGIVTCQACEIAINADSVKVVKPAPASAAA